MAPLGPFAPDRAVALAVSGGADSSALALLAAGWGRPFALIVDHGVRAGSADEAGLALSRLRERGIPGRILTLRGLTAGPGLQARARAARFTALTAACEEAGLVDLLLGHHARDQAETIAIRRGAGSGPDGLAGMAALRVAGPVRLLRPLLDVQPGRLRMTLAAAGMAWSEDPSNADLRFTRSRLRATGDFGLVGEAGAERQKKEAGGWPASVTISPAGYAVLPAGPVPVRTLLSAVWTVSGRDYPPSRRAVERVAGSATLHGTRIVVGRGLRFVVRECDAVRPGPARPGTVWDRRFLVASCGEPGAEIGMLGADAARLRGWSDLPAAVLETFPALRRDGALSIVPHLGYPSHDACAATRIAFRPAHVVAGTPFVPSMHASGVHLPAGHPMFAHDGGCRSGPDGGSGWLDLPED